MAETTVYASSGGGELLLQQLATAASCAIWQISVNATMSDTSSTYYRLLGSRAAIGGGKYNQYIRRGFIYFDLSSIPAVASVSSATLYVYIKSQSATYGIGPGLKVRSGQPTYPSESGGSPNLQLSDFGQAYYSDIASVADSSISVGSYNAISIPVGNINPGGLTKFCLTCDYECNGTDRYEQLEYYSNNAAEALQPKLTVVYDPGGETGIEASASVDATGDRVRYATAAISPACSLAGDPDIVCDGSAAISGVASIDALANYIVGSGVEIGSTISLYLDWGSPGFCNISATASISGQATRMRFGEVSIESAIALVLEATRVYSGQVTIAVNTSASAAALAYVTRTLGYTGNLSSGDRLVIDTDRMTVKLNGADVRANMTGDFVKLFPGTNTIKYEDSDGSRNISLDVEHEPRWL